MRVKPPAKQLRNLLPRQPPRPNIDPSSNSRACVGLKSLSVSVCLISLCSLCLLQWLPPCLLWYKQPLIRTAPVTRDFYFSVARCFPCRLCLKHCCSLCCRALSAACHPQFSGVCVCLCVCVCVLRQFKHTLVSAADVFMWLLTCSKAVSELLDSHQWSQQHSRALIHNLTHKHTCNAHTHTHTHTHTHMQCTYTHTQIQTHT